MNIKWTIQGQRGEARFPVREFDTKRKAVTAMEADRQPEDASESRRRNYRFTVKE